MNKLDLDYQALLQDILDNGYQKGDRTGTGTISVFGRQIRHKMSEGFPLLTTKKMYFRGIVTELLWFLRGDTNIKYLVDNDCHIWDGDAYKNYFNKTKDLTKDNFEAQGNGVIIIKGFDLKSVNQYGAISGTISDSYFRPYTQEEFINKIKTDNEFAKKWADLGPVYGRQWRDWGGRPINSLIEKEVYASTWVKGIDQIANLINDLKTNPDSRRLMVSALNVGELNQMVLPPCHYGFQVYTRELTMEERWQIADLKPNMSEFDWANKCCDELGVPKRSISLIFNMRSADFFLGVPFNIASYGLLLKIISKIVNMVPEEVIGNFGDTHLYSNHIEQAKEQIGQPIFEESPTLYPNGPMNEGIKKQIIVGHTREPYPLPKLVFSKTDEFFKELGNDLSLLSHLDPSDFKLENYQSHPTIKAPLSN